MMCKASQDVETSGECADKAQQNFDNPDLYLNREQATLQFNFRVLEQARDTAVPLLERLRFLCISVRNLDEFFEVQVAALRRHIAYGDARPGPDGLPMGEVSKRLREYATELVARQYECWNTELKPLLADQGILFPTQRDWTPSQLRWLEQHFRDEILPVLSPLGLDPSHPFPRILNKSLNLAVIVHGHDAFGREGNIAMVRAPRSLPRLIRIPGDESGSAQAFVFLSSLLQHFAGRMFPGIEVQGAYQFRVTRDSELEVEEDDIDNLAHALSEELSERGYALPVRLELAKNCPPALQEMLLANFGLTDDDVYLCAGPVNLHRVAAVYDMIERPDLKYPAFTPRVPVAFLPDSNVFNVISQRDQLLHHPYESFAPVLELLRQASVDPNVLAIKQTLYRIGEDSPLVGCLIDAARAGKDVTVVIELRARFDEEANIRLANRLQEVGVQVVYGVVGYKTHAKLLLIVRREGGVLRRYAHLGTGNYHQVTSKLYTDFGLMTADPQIGEDVHKVFQQLSSLGPVIQLARLLQSPFTLHRALLYKIDRETKHALAGRSARIIAKINALNEPMVIASLYAASCAGVQVDLIVRGACTLRPGLPGVSENIRVRSVIGRFLEHNRVYWFSNDGTPEAYCSSADWMERNLLRRVEVSFPISDPQLAQRVFDEALQIYLDDNTHAWELDADGEYRRAKPGDASPHSAQDELLARYSP